MVVIGGLMVGMMLASLDQTVLSVALPTIVGELGGLDHLSWVITAYLLTSTASVPLYGKLSDIYGRKIFFQAAIVIFVGGSMVCALAGDMTMLIIARGIQGVGAGGIFAMAMAIVGDILPPRDRGRYQGYIGSVFAFSSVAGPLVGGFFTDSLTWRWIFWLNLPLGIAALIVTTIVLRLPVIRREHSIDFIGAALLVAGVTALLLVASWGGTEYAWTSTTIVALGVAGVALVGVFVAQELRSAEPIVSLGLFKNRTVALASVILLIVGVGMFGAFAFLPLYLQVVKGSSPTESGLQMAPMMLPMIAASIISGRMISNSGRYRVFPILGTGLMVVGLFLLSQLEPGTSYLQAAAGMAILGSGLGMTVPVLTLAVQNAVDYQHLGTATASTNFFRSMGGAFGVAIAGAIVNNRLDFWLPRLISDEDLAGIDARTLTSSPEQLRQLPEPVLSGVVEAFSRSVDVAFLVAVPVVLVAFLLTWFLRENPLRETVQMGAATEDEVLAPAEPLV